MAYPCNLYSLHFKILVSDCDMFYEKNITIYSKYNQMKVGCVFICSYMSTMYNLVLG